jgi:formylglycine-generating enzyme required for sulfatase activity
MVRCSGGTFQIGNDADSTWPVHTVTVAPFEIDVTEVTVDAYAACVKRGECSPAETSDAKPCNWGVSGKGDHPVNCVDWEQATTYCHTLGKRLPSEEEWEFAARGGRERRSDSPAHERRGVQACGVGTSEHPGTCAVGSFPRGPFGLADMTGNVMEWTDSKFHDDETTRVIQHESEGPLHHWESDRSHRHDNVGFRCAR